MSEPGAERQRRDEAALLSNAEMGRADQAAIAGGTPGETLMENAGRAVAEAVQARWKPRPTLVCCGPGNNGGDGFVVARLLERAGWPVRLALLGDRTALKGDAAHHAGLWRGGVLLLDQAAPQPGELVVDALFGAGLSKPLGGAARDVARQVGAMGLDVVAVDVPSGLSGDSGQVMGDTALAARLTVTFFRKKPGHLLLPGRQLVGELVVADIGIPEGVLQHLPVQAWENGPDGWGAVYPRRRPGDHKYSAGHALVLGGPTMTGAARLAARAALRVGAGLVTLACPRDAWMIYALASASVITAPFSDPSGFEALLEDERRNAVLLGPGSGVSDQTRRFVLAALGKDKRCLLDADALSVFQEDPEALFAQLRDDCVLTPHEGEFRRLFPECAGDKLARCRAAARKSGAVVLLKGADTVIAAPDGRARLNSNAPSSLATAGSGDVLAGLVTGLLAQGMPAFDAASAGAWLHGEAATLFGPGLIAEDLPELLPKVVRLMAKK